VVVVKAASPKADQTTVVSGGALGARSALETPFSTNAVTSDEIEERQAQSLADVFRYDASVRNGRSNNNEQASTTGVRGLFLDNLNGYKVDGMANLNRGIVMPLEAFERVEVLKGLTGFMYGFGSPGGIINYVSKRAGDDTLLSATVGMQSNSVLRAHVDMGARFGEGNRYGLRLNLVNQHGEQAENSGPLDRRTAALAGDVRLSANLSLTLDLIHQHRHAVGGTGISTTTSFDVPTPLDGGSTFSSISGGVDASYNLQTLGLAYQLSPDWKITAATRHADTAVINKKDALKLSSSSGNFDREITSSYTAYRFGDSQLMAQGQLATAGVLHDLVVGLSELKLEGLTANNVSKVVGKGNLYSEGVPFDATNFNYSGPIYRNLLTTQSAQFVSDTLTLSEQWSLLGGLRRSRYSSTSFDAKGMASGYSRTPTTPTLAVMYRPRADTTVYASTVQALEQSAQAPVGTSNAGQLFPPTISKQLELGAKTQQAQWNGSVALFQMRRASQYINDVNAYVQDGFTRYRGIELAADWTLTRALSVAGSTTLRQNKIEYTAPKPNSKQPLSPKVQAGLEANYRVAELPGLRLHGGLQYVGSMPFDVANVHTMPSYTLLDAGLSYRTRYDGHGLTWRANISNLGNRRYWLVPDANSLNIGTPRVLSVNARLDF